MVYSNDELTERKWYSRFNDPILYDSAIFQYVGGNPLTFESYNLEKGWSNLGEITYDNESNRFARNEIFWNFEDNPLMQANSLNNALSYSSIRYDSLGTVISTFNFDFSFEYDSEGYATKEDGPFGEVFYFYEEY